MFSCCCGRTSSCKEADKDGDEAAQSRLIEKQIKKDKRKYKSTHRLQLVGPARSGKSTIINQVKTIEYAYV